MQLVRVLVGWVVASGLFLLVDVLWLRRGGGVKAALVEGAPFTLLAALWFASIGRGTWPLVFALLGVVAEAGRLRDGKLGKALVGMAPTVAKFVVAGLALRWVL